MARWSMNLARCSMNLARCLKNLLFVLQYGVLATALLCHLYVFLSSYGNRVMQQLPCRTLLHAARFPGETMIEYRIRPLRPEAHLFEVTLTVAKPTPEGFELNWRRSREETRTGGDSN